MNRIIKLFLPLVMMSTAYAATDQVEFVSRIAKSLDVVEQNQQQIWPGFHPNHTASVIAFTDENENTSVYAIHLKPQTLPWQLVSTDFPIYYLNNANSLGLTGEDDASIKRVEMQKSYIDIEDPKNYIGNENLLNKFMSNRAQFYFQHEAHIKPADTAYTSLDYDDFNKPELLKLFFLEDAALTLAQQDDTGRAELALRDGVAIHQYRHQLMSKEAIIFENGNEIIQGTPQFISWTSKQLTDSEYRKMTQRTGCRPLSSLFDPYMMTDCVLRGSPAFNSAVYGHALDKKTGYRWKKTLEKQFNAISHLMIDYYHFSDAEAKLLAEQAMHKAEYHYDRISRIVEHTMTPYLQALNHAQQAYHASADIEVRMPSELGYTMLILGNFGNFYQELYQFNIHDFLIEDLTLADENDTSMFFKHLPFMFIHTANHGFEIDPVKSYTSMKLEDDAKVIIDGRVWQAKELLNKGQSISFKQLIIDDEHARFPLDAKGTLQVIDGKLIIKFDEAFFKDYFISSKERLSSEVSFKRSSNSRADKGLLK